MQGWRAWQLRRRAEARTEPARAAAAASTPCTHAPAALAHALQRGLTVPQSLLFFEAAAHHMLALGTIFMAIV